MKKIGNILCAVAFAGSASAALALDDDYEVVERELQHITCTNDRNGAFSFHLDSYDEPIISILKSKYGMDASHAVLSHAPSVLPSIYPPTLEERSDVKLSEAFKENWANFNGRFLMFFNPDEEGRMLCSIEEEFPAQKVIRRNFVLRSDVPEHAGP